MSCRTFPRSAQSRNTYYYDLMFHPTKCVALVSPAKKYGKNKQRSKPRNAQAQNHESNDEDHDYHQTLHPLEPPEPSPPPHALPEKNQPVICRPTKWLVCDSWVFICIKLSFSCVSLLGAGGTGRGWTSYLVFGFSSATSRNT